VDYRQLPHAHITDTLDDAVEAYRYLLEHGFGAERIIVPGDSAGSGLAFRLALATRERGLPMPATASRSMVGSTRHGRRCWAGLSQARLSRLETGPTIGRRRDRSVDGIGRRQL
jgi:hypothetical protein